MKLKNKILLIIIIFIALFMVSDSKCFAGTEYVWDWNSETHENKIIVNSDNFPSTFSTGNNSYNVSGYLIYHDTYDVGVDILVLYQGSGLSISYESISNRPACLFRISGNNTRYAKYYIYPSSNDLGYVFSMFSAGDNIFNYYLDSTENEFPFIDSSEPILDFTSQEVVFREAGTGESGGGDTGNTNTTNTGSESTNTVDSTNSSSGNSGGGGSFNGTGSSSSFEEDDSSNGWSIVGSIFNVIKNIFSGIGNIVSSLGNLIDYLLPNPSEEDDEWIITDILNIFSDLIDYLLPNPLDSNDKWIVKDIKDVFLDLFRTIFIPGNNYFSSQYSDISDRLDNKIHFRQHYEALEAINNNISQGGQTNIDTFVELPEYRISDGLSVRMLRFIDFSFLGQYRDTWFAWCRVVFYLMIVIYNLSQILKFLNGHTVVEGSNQIQGVSNGGKHSEGVGKH